MNLVRKTLRFSLISLLLTIVIASSSFSPSRLLPPTTRMVLTVDTGQICFSGDTAVFYIFVKSNGNPFTPDAIQLMLIRPDGINVTFKAASLTQEPSKRPIPSQAQAPLEPTPFS